MTEAEQIMKRCQAGTRNYEEANNLHAACYGIIGKLLAQPEQEPVAIVDANDDGYWADILPNRSVKVGQMLYTQPQRKPLTVDEAISAVSSVLPVPSTGGQTHHWQIQYKYALEIVRAIEAAHNIKETP